MVQAAGTLAVAGQPAAAGAPVIEVITGAPAGGLVAASTVTASHSFRSFRAITIKSQGVDIEGTVKIQVRTFDYRILWQVYNLPSMSGWNEWVGKFSQDSSHTAVKQAIQTDVMIDIDVEIKFKVAASALEGVSTLRVGFETLLLQLDGTAMAFPVVNTASGGAKDQNNRTIPVEFEPF